MPTRTWNVLLEGQPHIVLFGRNPWTNFRAVWVDGRLAATGSASVFRARPLVFAIDAHPAELLNVQAGFTYRYLLFVDNQPHVAREDDPAGDWIQPLVEWRNFWPDLARLTGLPYLPDAKGRAIGQNRLFGLLQGLPLFVRPISNQPGYLRSLAVTVRFAPAADLDHLKKQIRQDAQLKALLGDPLATTSELTSTYYQTWLSQGLKTRPADVAAQRVRDLVMAIRQYVDPPRLDVCEWPTGPHDTSQPPRLVLVNDVPQSLCLACAADLSHRTSVSLKAFRQAPPGRLKAALASLGATLLAALVGAALLVSIGTSVGIAPLLGGLIFGLNARLMDRNLGKRLLSSMLFAVVLGVVGGWLCLYLANVWLVLSNAGRDGNLFTVLRLAAQTMWPTAPTDTRRFEGELGLVGLLCTLALFDRWRERRRLLQRILYPRVEALGQAGSPALESPQTPSAST